MQNQVDLNRQLEKRDKRLAPLTDDFALLDAGVDSLCFAIAVARLENSRERDPFNANKGAGFSVTFDDFIRFYENAAN